MPGNEVAAIVASRAVAPHWETIMPWPPHGLPLSAPDTVVSEQTSRAASYKAHYSSQDSKLPGMDIVVRFKQVGMELVHQPCWAKGPLAPAIPL